MRAVTQINTQIVYCRHPGTGSDFDTALPEFLLRICSELFAELGQDNITGMHKYNTN
jgi:hypothetical protein